MSFVSRLLNIFKKPIRFVGRDLEGNRFYEHPSSSEDLRRTKRTVQYHDPAVVWQYIGGGKRLPVQWAAWLTHTRHHPPTLEELQTDMARQQHLQLNVARIEARDRAESEEMLRLNHNAVPMNEAVQAPSPDPEIPQPDNSKEQSLHAPLQQPEKLKSPWKLPTNPEPESWSPRARKRGE